MCADVFAEGASKDPAGDPSDGPPAGGPFAPGSFDVVFCSGAFNLNLGNNDEFLPRAVARLFELAREYVVFNLLHVRSACDDPKYAWYDPADVRGAVRPFAADCRILDDYLPNDFTVICRKADLSG